MSSYLAKSFVDGIGIYGEAFSYAVMLSFLGGALLLFIYFWREGKLSFDEEAKWQMIQMDEQGGVEKEESNDLGNR